MNERLNPLVKEFSRDDEKEKRPTYGPEFKAQAVAKCLEIAINRTSQELGIAYATLKSWVSKSQQKESKSDKTSYEELESEIKRLKKENGYINEINKNLKKAQSCFPAAKWVIFVD